MIKSDSMTEEGGRRKIDLSSWARAEHFHFFRQFDEPSFGLVSSIPCGAAYERSKRDGISFFKLYLHAVLRAVNEVEALRLRMDGDVVYLFDRIHVSSTLLREDHSFAFSFIPFDPDFSVFSGSVDREKAAAMASTGLRNRGQNQRPDVVHFSALPWLSFTALDHPRFQPGGDGIPKISVGRMFRDQGDWKLPVSLHAHHGLADGYHAGLFFTALETLLS